ncbi:hypothetical protein Tco_0985931, partial [Tanacetum coccineum]
MDLLSFIQTADPTNVRVGESQRAEDEPRLLDTTMGRVVPLLPIAPACAESELDASVDKLFDEGGSGNQAKQGDSASGGHGVGIQLVSEAVETVVEDATPMSVVQRLLIGAVQNAKVKGKPILTLPFVTSSVSATPEHEDEGHTDFATGLNIRTIGAPPRFVISSDSSHHSDANIVKAEVNSFARPSIPLMKVATIVSSTVDPATTVKEKFVGPSVFGGDSSGGGDDHTVGGFYDLTGSDFILGDDGRTCHEMVNDQLFTEFNIGAARQMSLSAEIRMRVEYNIKEKRRLNSVVEGKNSFMKAKRRLNSVMEEKNSLLKAKDEEVESLKGSQCYEGGRKPAEASVSVRVRISKFEVVEKSLRDEVKVLKEQNSILEQEELIWVTFAKSQSDKLADRVHKLETSSARLQEKVTA